MLKKRILCLALACILLAGVLGIGIGAYAETAFDKDGLEVSDYFYMQLYDSQDQVVSKYKVMLTGIVSGKKVKITSVTFSRESGDLCDTSFAIDGNIAVATVSHPVEGYWEGAFLLNSDGVFSGY